MIAYLQSLIRDDIERRDKIKEKNRKKYRYDGIQRAQQAKEVKCERMDQVAMLVGMLNEQEN